MGSVSERRALLNEDNDEFDPTLSVDVNEYLIETFPQLNLTQRRSVWHTCQNDEDFDYSSIEEQIDYIVYDLADGDDSWILPDSNESEDEEEDDEDIDDDECNELFKDALAEYLIHFWAVPAEMDEKELNNAIAELADMFDDQITEYFDDEEEE